MKGGVWACWPYMVWCVCRAIEGGTIFWFMCHTAGGGGAFTPLCTSFSEHTRPVKGTVSREKCIICVFAFLGNCWVLNIGLRSCFIFFHFYFLDIKRVSWSALGWAQIYMRSALFQEWLRGHSQQNVRLSVRWATEESELPYFILFPQFHLYRYHT